MRHELLEIQGLSRYFGGVRALDQFDLNIREGEIRGLIGPNGAGKTTFFNVVSGFLQATKGHIAFQGVDITRMPIHMRAKIGIRRTFQNLQLFRQMTTLQNVMIGLHGDTHAEVFDALLRTPRQKREEEWTIKRALEILSFVGLGRESHLSAAALPYGHMRILEIARALVSKPKLLMLDEPAAGLNTAETISLGDLIRRINQSGVTIILVDHRMDLVMKICENVTVLNYGEKLAEGSPGEIQNNTQVIEAYLGRNRAVVNEGDYAPN